MAKRVKRKAPVLRPFVGYADVEQRIWAQFQRKQRNHAATLLALEDGSRSPLWGTVVSIAWDPGYLLTGWGGEDLIAAMGKAPDATLALLCFVRNERAKMLKHDASKAEFTLRSQHFSATVAELQKLQLATTNKNVAGSFGVTEKGVRNAKEKMARSGIAPKS